MSKWLEVGFVANLSASILKWCIAMFILINTSQILSIMKAFAGLAVLKAVDDEVVRPRQKATFKQAFDAYIALHKDDRKGHFRLLFGRKILSQKEYIIVNASFFAKIFMTFIS